MQPTEPGIVLLLLNVEYSMEKGESSIGMLEKIAAISNERTRNHKPETRN
jgi:hypothetical protein